MEKNKEGDDSVKPKGEFENEEESKIIFGEHERAKTMNRDDTLIVLNEPITRKFGSSRLGDQSNISSKLSGIDMNSKLNLTSTFEPKQKTNFQIEIVPQSTLVLASKPYFVARTHFISQTQSDELWKDIQGKMEEQKMLDFEIGNSDDLKDIEIINSVFHASPGDLGGGNCQFNVQMFRQEEDGNILVEFQFRSGCPWTFQSIYRRMFSNLKKHILSSPCSPRMPMSSKDYNLSTSICLDDDTFKCIYDMANSDLLDVASEGMLSLAEFSYNKKNQVFLLDYVEKIVSLMGKTLKIEIGDYNLQRYSTVLIANLSSHDQFKKQLLTLKDQLIALDSSNGVSGRGSDYDKIYRLYFKDMKRQIKTVLDNLEVSVN